MGQTENGSESAIRARVDDLIAESPMSGVILAEQSGQTVFQKAYGAADRSQDIPNTLDTRFPIASGCKVFTSVSVCRLVERGLLSFDTRLQDCLDIRFPHFDPSITVHHLLTHSSGIPDYFDEEVENDYEALWRTKPMYQMREPADFLPMFSNEPMMFEPGERFSYSNSGYILLGLIVERVSGESFARHVEGQLLTPCGMSESGYFALDCLPARAAQAYLEDESGSWRTNIYSVPVVGGPDGGAFTTASDMGRFWQALFSHELLGEPVTERLLRAHVATRNEPRSTHYGYGVWMASRPDADLHYVCGWDPGVSFLSVAHGHGQRVITLLSNTNRALWPLHDAILDLLPGE